jgi:hypothetical protein
MSQIIEQLPSKCTALSSNPSTAIKQRRKKEGRKEGRKERKGYLIIINLGIVLLDTEKVPLSTEMIRNLKVT